ncbi:MAG: hypothetical protein DCC75_01220 [Proteobacteria bacterium]|nr:MAG: hypothetical protein DCC75_01220 [Pseudomonadota bacterium]
MIGVLSNSPRSRRPTVLIHLGAGYSLSKRAFELGLLLAVLQLADGLLTYVGLNIYGIHLEGNAFLRSLMHVYGTFPVLFFTKLFALGCVAWLTILAHDRRWIRPAIAFVSGIYITAAIIPWSYLVSAATTRIVP